MGTTSSPRSPGRKKNTKTECRFTDLEQLSGGEGWLKLVAKEVTGGESWRRRYQNQTRPPRT